MVPVSGYQVLPAYHKRIDSITSSVIPCHRHQAETVFYYPIKDTSYRISHRPPPVNASTDASSAPSSMQFGACLPCLLQNIWEAYLANGTVLLSKWEISDGFHRCLLRPADVGDFTYVVHPIPEDPEIYLCVDLVLPMGWFNSPPFFCAASETATDLANAYLANPQTPWMDYAPKRDIYATTPNDTASSNRLQKVEVYMDDFMGMTQGDPDQQERVKELLLRDIKETFPSVPDETKDSISFKKELQGNGS